MDTRRPLHSLPAVAPLVLAHAFLTWLFEPPVTAAAANWVQWPLLRLGLGPGEAAMLLAALFVLVGIALSYRDLERREIRFRPALLPWIWVEGTLWGFALHVAWNGLFRGGAGVDGLGPGDHLALALGAGVYEELVFRVAGFWVVLKLLELAARGAGKPEPARAWRRRLLAVLITSFLFAAAHHIGPEPITLSAMSFRFVAALLFTSLYAWRGLGIAACAHAAYDVFVVAL